MNDISLLLKEKLRKAEEEEKIEENIGKRRNFQERATEIAKGILLDRISTVPDRNLLLLRRGEISPIRIGTLLRESEFSGLEPGEIIKALEVVSKEEGEVFSVDIKDVISNTFTIVIAYRDN